MMATTSLIYLVPIGWLGLLVALSCLWRLLSGKPIAPRVPAGAAFGETMCSGRLPDGILGAVGGVANCLVVAIHNDRLNVALAFPFSLIPSSMFGALELDVPVKDITQITTGRWLFYDALRIDFGDPNRASIELVVRNEAGFVAALGPNVKRSGKRKQLSKDTSPRLSARFLRIFFVIMGVGVLIGSGLILSEQWLARADGVTTTGTVVAITGKETLVRYRVKGADFYLTSNFAGDWVIGQTETIIYQKDDPTHATEAGLLSFGVFLILLGLAFLVFGLYGPRLVPGWS